MIQCHTFNSFVRPDMHASGTYVLSQFAGGMAAPLFLFMAGMTLAFLMDSADRRCIRPARRWLIALRRGAYVLGIAYLFRLTNYVFSLPKGDWQEVVKVDILNAMGLAMMVFAVAALFRTPERERFAAALGLAIAAASPVIASLNWTWAPVVLREYLVPGPGGGRFAFFPYASYVGFGLTAGTIIRYAEDLERLMQWSVLLGLSLVIGGQYFSNIPFSFYANSEFWVNSPALVVIRIGVSLMLLAGAYLWTEYCARQGWSWMQCLGRNSLMVYWVHVMLVYGDVTKRLHGTLGIGQAVAATLAVLGLMTGLSAAWLEWKRRRAATRQAAARSGDLLVRSS